MTQVILTADVDDGAAWEAAYRTHGDLFRDAGIGTVHFTVGADNHVVMCTDVDDVDAYMDFVRSETTQEAMQGDGVRRDSVRVFVLEKSFSG